MITVTKTWLPDEEKYHSYVKQIYKTGWITNYGPLVQELERRLAKYLGVKNLILTANGTIALQTAYRLLNLQGDVITTPFSFVATTSSLVTNGLNPVFADINKDTLNIDPCNIEKEITPATSAIVPTHIFGNACEVEKISEVAEKYNLKVIYDAAHSFGIKYKNRTLASYGDVSILSFHATKIFHSIEGGAIIVNDDALVEKARKLINFGFDGYYSIDSIGINGKMNEFEAAMGLCMLDDIDTIIEKSKEIYDHYYKELHSHVSFQKRNLNSNNNFNYVPLLFKDSQTRQKVESLLLEENIFARRYFYPSLDTLDYVESKKTMYNSRDIANRVLCIPIYPSLVRSSQNKIINIIKETICHD